MIPATHRDIDLEKNLMDLPDEVADAKYKWRESTIKRQAAEAALFVKLKATLEKPTVEEIKANIRTDQKIFALSMAEVLAESDYDRVYKRLMSAKKLADLRTAY